MSKRADSDEYYVIDLCDAALGSRASRQHRFEWLRGDYSEKTRRQSFLPVDAYWEELGLVVEYAERQHDEPVAIFDKPEVLTVSGVHRGEQRRIYDARRVDLIPKNGIALIVIPASSFALKNGKIVRNFEEDLQVVRTFLPVETFAKNYVTPEEIAAELGLSGKTVRDYLRSEHGLLADQDATRWRLDSVRAADVRQHFSGKL